MPRTSLPRWALVALIAAPTFGAGVAVSAAASSSPHTFYACLKGGTLSRVSTVSHRCPSGRAVSWNSVGPQGVLGAQGLKGDTGLGFEPTLTWTAGVNFASPPASMCTDLGVGSFTNACENATYVATQALPADAADYQPSATSRVCVTGPMFATIGNASGVPLQWSYAVWQYHGSTATLIASYYWSLSMGPGPYCVALPSSLSLSAGDRLIAGGVAGPFQKAGSGWSAFSDGIKAGFALTVTPQTSLEFQLPTHSIN
jgi:hypothetical protein